MAVRGKHGAMLAGRYRLLEQLGEGGMGSVWKAEHLLLHSLVAIKIIDPDVARLEFNLARFLREAKTLATLRSPNVVQVLDFGSDADTPYLVMELLEGQTLGRRLSEQGRLSLSEMSRVMNDVCRAMSLVHDQGLIHRDLKPENIFLCDNGEQRVTKVVDFGIAKSLRGDMSASMKTHTGHMLGTPSYMSPEQCRGLKDIDHRADLWALGVITYECLVGKVPFEGEVLGDLLLRICMDPLPIPSRNFIAGGPQKGNAKLANGNVALPASFDAWFAKAVARDRAERYQSAAELASSLAELSVQVGLAATLYPRDGDSRDGYSRDGGSRDGGSRDGDSRDRSAREGPPREGLEPSRSSVPRVSPASSGAASATPRQPSNTETNTTVGLVGAALKVDRRAKALAIAAVALAAGAGLWALGNKGAGGRADEVKVQSLRPPFEVTPKTIRPRVSSGRRWQSSPDPARSPPEGSVQEYAEESSATRDTLPGTAKVPPGIQPPSSASPETLASGGAGSSALGAAAPQAFAASQPPATRPAGAAQPSASGQRAFGPAASAPPGAAVTGAAVPPEAPGQGTAAGTKPGTAGPTSPGSKPRATPPGDPVTPSAGPPRALRGTAAPGPRRAPAAQASETNIRRTR